MGITPNGHSMEWSWDLSLGMPWNSSKFISCGSTNGHSMEWPWDFSWGVGGGFSGMLLWVAPGDPTQWPFHGMALGLLMGGIPWNASMGSSWGITQWCSMCSSWGSHPMAIPWSGFGTSHWGCHGMLLGLAHVVPPMAIPWNGLGTSHGGGSLACFYR